MTPEHLGAIIRLYDPMPDYRSWVHSQVTAYIVVGGTRVHLSHNGRGKERVAVTLPGDVHNDVGKSLVLYFDDAVELMAYLERLRE